MTGDISGKRANQSLKEHLCGPKLTHTHTYTHKSCKEMDGIKRSHSEQHWIIKKAKGGESGTGWEGEDTDAMEVILVTG